MGAKRHHYVPRFLLARFSPEPTAANPSLFCLDKETGRTDLRSVSNEAVIKHHNRLENALSVPPDVAAELAAAGAKITWDETAPEQLLAIIEGNAAASVDKLVAQQRLTPDERLMFAMFLWLQKQRTPQGREWTKFFFDKSANLQALVSLSDHEHVKRVLEESDGPKTMEEVRAWCAQTAKEMEEGKLWVEGGKDHEVLGMFVGAEAGAEHIARDMTWTGLRAPEGSQFILSDHPIAFFDPKASIDEPVGWLSSPSVQVTLPLDPSFCLLMRPGPAVYRTERVDRSVVRDINLRTYSWGHWNIYGTCAAAVQQVRAEAKQNRLKVAVRAPRSPRLFIGETVEGELQPYKVDVYRPPARGSRKRRRQ